MVNIRRILYKNKIIFDFMLVVRQYLYCLSNLYKKQEYIRLICCALNPFCRMLTIRQNKKDLKESFQHDLALIAICKNEAEYLPEWIEYHAYLGVSKFLIYDNGSNDNTLEVLQPYIEAGLVEYRWYPGERMQVSAYSDAIVRVKPLARYVAFMDIDEFLCVNDESKNIKEFMDDFFRTNLWAGGIAIGWWMFGSNYHKVKPEGLVMENYLRRADESFMLNVKTIGNPRLMVGCYSPHYPVYLYLASNANEKGKKVRGPFDYSKSTDVIHINHYFTKSEAECMQKIAKGIATKGTPRTKEIFYQRDKNDIYDDSMLRYVSIVKDAILARTGNGRA